MRAIRQLLHGRIYQFDEEFALLFDYDATEIVLRYGLVVRGARILILPRIPTR